jgi:hypothetical protein
MLRDAEPRHPCLSEVAWNGRNILDSQNRE